MAPHRDEHQTIQTNTAIVLNNINNNIYNYNKHKKAWPIVDYMVWTSERVQEAKILTHLDTVS